MFTCSVALQQERRVFINIFFVLSTCFLNASVLLLLSVNPAWGPIPPAITCVVYTTTRPSQHGVYYPHIHNKARTRTLKLTIPCRQVYLQKQCTHHIHTHMPLTVAVEISGSIYCVDFLFIYVFCKCCIQLCIVIGRMDFWPYFLVYVYFIHLILFFFLFGSVVISYFHGG